MENSQSTNDTQHRCNKDWTSKHTHMYIYIYIYSKLSSESSPRSKTPLNLARLAGESPKSNSPRPQEWHLLLRLSLSLSLCICAEPTALLDFIIYTKSRLYSPPRIVLPSPKEKASRSPSPGRSHINAPQISQPPPPRIRPSENYFTCLQNRIRLAPSWRFVVLVFLRRTYIENLFLRLPYDVLA